MKTKDKPRAKFFVDKKGRFVHDALIFMIMAVLFRLTGCWGMWNDRFFLITQMLLPLAAALLFILCLRLLGEKALVLSCVPVLMGAAFHVFRALGFETTLNTVLSIAAAVCCALAYTFTVAGVIRTKWLLPPLFLLPLLYHVAVVDVAALRNAADPVLFAEGMQELSVLCTLISMLFATLAFKRRKSLEEAGLPKIKDPVVIVAKPKDEKPQSSDNTAKTEDKPAEAESRPAETAAKTPDPIPAVPAETEAIAENAADSGNTAPAGQQTDSGATT